MRAPNWNMHWPNEAEILNYLRRLGSKDIEIGLGATIWASLVFVVVHFGGGSV